MIGYALLAIDFEFGMRSKMISFILVLESVTMRWGNDGTLLGPRATTSFLISYPRPRRLKFRDDPICHDTGNLVVAAGMNDVSATMVYSTILYMHHIPINQSNCYAFKTER